MDQPVILVHQVTLVITGPLALVVLVLPAVVVALWARVVSYIYQPLKVDWGPCIRVMEMLTPPHITDLLVLAVLVHQTHMVYLVTRVRADPTVREVAGAYQRTTDQAEVAQEVPGTECRSVQRLSVLRAVAVVDPVALIFMVPVVLVQLVMQVPVAPEPRAVQVVIRGTAVVLEVLVLVQTPVIPATLDLTVMLVLTVPVQVLEHLVTLVLLVTQDQPVLRQLFLV